MQIIDLSVSLQAGIASDPPALLPDITYLDHTEGASRVISNFPGMTVDLLPDQAGPAVELVRISTHNGTHLDAPWHMHPTMNGGEPAMRIDEVPLDWCYRPGIKLDFRQKAAGYVCTADDIRRELDRIEHDLQPLDIVLINTAAGEAYGEPDYIDRGCGVGREATLYLLERGVRLTGIDGWGWDAPFSSTRNRWLATRDPSIVWEGHKAGREIGYCHLEKLTNLDRLPDKGFTVVCFPVKVHRASAGWTRAVALLQD